MNLSPVRAPGESQAAYRARLKANNKERKNYLRRGADMVKHWLQRNPHATPEQIAEARRQFPRKKFFKVQVPVEKRQGGEQ